MIFIVMGVAGCGKTTVGKLLAESLGYKYIEGDEYHPAENVKKMSSGIPLNDDDRYGWLVSLRKEIELSKAHDQGAVLTCSALKEKYRKILKQDDEDVKFIYLKGSFEAIKSRMEQRQNHYFKPSLLQSQFDTLEEPAYAFTADALAPAEETVQNVLAEYAVL
ncbi:MAG: gluconokinase [Ignavibacteriaceae bacterium]